MRRTSLAPFIGLALFLCALFVFPRRGVEKLRFTLSSLSPKAVAFPREEEALGFSEKEDGARVIQRDANRWDSFLWINKGRANSRVEENSIAMYGGSIVGVVEKVGKNRSLLRLITDSKLPVAVRVARGGEQDRYLRMKLIELLEYCSLRMLSSDDDRIQQVYTACRGLERLWQTSQSTLLLAKGEVRGRGSPVWRSYSYRLVGEGFQYDFADEEGPPRDLRSGIPYTEMGKQKQLRLIEVGDLLVTTGMDGVFPKGYPVGYVSKVHPLEEGATSYSIEAVAAAGNLHTLEQLTLLPPITKE